MPALQLFIIYAREDQPALLELKAHLRPLEKRGDLTVWYDGEILPGADWDKAIKAQLATADIVLLFISKSFFNSEYIEKEELKKALERHQKGEATVVPVIVRPCLWDVHPEISALQVLPKDGKAVSSWGEADEAFTDVVRGVQKLMVNRKESEEAMIAVEKVEEGIKLYHKFRTKEAFELLSKYTDNDYPVNAEAYYLMGEIYRHGDAGVKIDYNKAVDWYRRAANLNHTASQAILGVIYSLIKEWDDAFMWFLKAANNGDALSQAGLGICYEKGFGTEIDLETALLWYKKSANQGQTEAKACLKRLGYSE